MTKTVALLIILLSFFSCKKANNDPSVSHLNPKDIDEIVETIIIDDSLTVLKEENNYRMFCDSLIKLDIHIPEKRMKEGDLPPPPLPFHSISIYDLLSEKDSLTFKPKDSLFLINQNSGIGKLAIEKTLADKINITTKGQEIDKKESGKSYDYYEMTIPLFSSDYKKAYVILNHYCGRLCGGGRSIWLEKKNGKWIIIHQSTRWIS